MKRRRERGICGRGFFCPAGERVSAQRATWGQSRSLRADEAGLGRNAELAAAASVVRRLLELDQVATAICRSEVVVRVGAHALASGDLHLSLQVRSLEAPVPAAVVPLGAVVLPTVFYHDARHSVPRAQPRVDLSSDGRVVAEPLLLTRDRDDPGVPELFVEMFVHAPEVLPSVSTGDDGCVGHLHVEVVQHGDVDLHADFLIRGVGIEHIRHLTCHSAEAMVGEDVDVLDLAVERQEFASGLEGPLPDEVRILQQLPGEQAAIGDVSEALGLGHQRMMRSRVCGTNNCVGNGPALHEPSVHGFGVEAVFWPKLGQDPIRKSTLAVLSVNPLRFLPLWTNCKGRSIISAFKNEDVENSAVLQQNSSVYCTFIDTLVQSTQSFTLHFLYLWPKNQL